MNNCGVYLFIYFMFKYCFIFVFLIFYFYFAVNGKHDDHHNDDGRGDEPHVNGDSKFFYIFLKLWLDLKFWGIFVRPHVFYCVAMVTGVT